MIYDNMMKYKLKGDGPLLRKDEYEEGIGTLSVTEAMKLQNFIQILNTQVIERNEESQAYVVQRKFYDSLYWIYRRNTNLMEELWNTKTWTPEIENELADDPATVRFVADLITFYDDGGVERKRKLGLSLIAALVINVLKINRRLGFKRFYAENQETIDNITDDFGPRKINALRYRLPEDPNFEPSIELQQIMDKIQEYDNMSQDKRIGFIEKDHKYVDTKNPKHYYRSVTGLLKDYKEPFLSRETAEKVRNNRRSKYFGLEVEEILSMWKHAADIGTALHLYGEKLFNGIDAEPPDDPRAVYVPQVIEHITSNGYTLAKTELLVYSAYLKLAGQSDIILKKEIGDKTFFMIYDWKFLSSPLQKKSYYNRRERSFKMMSGPFKYLNDCNWIHYSIQLALYQTLSGNPAKVTEKVLIAVTNNGYELVPAYPMRCFWDDYGLQAIYETYSGKYYDSRTDQLTTDKPTDIVAL